MHLKYHIVCNENRCVWGFVYLTVLGLYFNLCMGLLINYLFMSAVNMTKTLSFPTHSMDSRAFYYPCHNAFTPSIRGSIRIIPGRWVAVMFHNVQSYKHTQCNETYQPQNHWVSLWIISTLHKPVHSTTRTLLNVTTVWLDDIVLDFTVLSLHRSAISTTYQ